MKRVIAVLALAWAAQVVVAQDASKQDWKQVKRASGVTIYSRPHPGSHLKEFKAIGEIDASSGTVHRVIDDVEAYPNFMPYTAEARVIERNQHSILSYQRVSPKIVSDRDYTVRIEKKSWPVDNGIAYLSEWKQANEHGPAEKPGVFRVKLLNGSWLLEPNGPNKTRATYHVFTDSGIVVPPFLANKISETGITKLFAAVRKQVKEPKYQTK
ncbi:MAG TPA: START domain-containing protein [Chthoniobacterales bacterium]|nr:START domain-containing protein [Chthoniobacterales bacterium]